MTADTIIDDALLAHFSEFLARRIGLHFPRARWPDLRRGVTGAVAEFAQPDPASCIRWLLGTPLNRRQIEILASHLTVGETYFYREPALFAALETHILPPLIAARRAGERTLRLWSAGCCTGEEAYTLATVLYRLLPDIDQWNIQLLATDINPGFIARAEEGRYRDWSFRGTPPGFRERYFTVEADGNYRLLPAIRRLVHFGYLNLVDDVYPSLDSDTNGMDVVLCRNVLMYFDSDGVRAVVAKLRRALAPDGWLALSATESASPSFAGLTTVAFPGITLYRKHGAAPSPLLPPASATAPLVEMPSLPPAPLPVATSRPAIAAPPESAAMPPPKESAALYEQALAHYQQGDYARAASLLAEGEADNPRCQALAAHAWANLGQLERALRCGEAAVAADKCDPGLRYLLASLLVEQGQSSEAAAAFKQAIYLDQDFVLAHFALGNLYRRLAQTSAAARHYATARRLLAGYPADAVLPAGEGLTAGRLLAIIEYEGEQA